MYIYRVYIVNLSSLKKENAESCKKLYFKKTTLNLSKGNFLDNFFFQKKIIKVRGKNL